MLTVIDEFRTREAAVELGDPGPLVEEHLPVIGRPAAVTGTQTVGDPGLVARQGVESGLRR